jgi:hypothetical protein
MLQGAASKFLNLPTTLEDVRRDGPAQAHGAQLTMASAEHQLELRIAVATDQATARALSVHLFGPDQTDLVDDMLGELTNILMGSLKTALNSEGFAFAADLPSKIDPALAERPNVLFKYQEVFSLRVNESRVLVHLGLRSKMNSVVTVSQLTEGMVLAKDLYNMRGALIIQCGTRLSSTMIERLRTAMPSQAPAEVSAR